MALRWRQDGPQEGPRRLPDGPKTAQDEARTAQHRASQSKLKAIKPNVKMLKNDVQKIFIFGGSGVPREAQDEAKMAPRLA